MELREVGLFLGLFFTVGAVIFALTVYNVQGQIDENLAYMALYYDGVAVDLYDTGADLDAVVMIELQASHYCDLYLAERRTIDEWKYKPICDVVYARGVRIVGCYDYPELCLTPDPELDNLIELADPVAQDLLELRPYMSYIFSEDPVLGERYYLGSEEVPCPWTQ